MNNILNQNLFTKQEDFSSMSEILFDSSIINYINNKKENNLERAAVFSEKEINVENKNVFIINGDKDIIAQNLQSDNYRNFLNIWDNLRKVVLKNYKNISINILNFIGRVENNFNDLEILEEKKRDIVLMRSINNINIFVPADIFEAKYLLRINLEKNNLENIAKQYLNNSDKLNKNKNHFSYFRLSNEISRTIFDKDYFENKIKNKKIYTGEPEIIYISKNQESHFEITLVSCGPIIYNVIIAAKELEKNNFKVTVLNVSTLISNDENINNNIKKFWRNFSLYHKNILIIEEHSNIGGLGSIIIELLNEEKNINSNIKIKKLGIENDLSVRNIVYQAENFISI